MTCDAHFPGIVSFPWWPCLPDIIPDRLRYLSSRISLTAPSPPTHISIPTSMLYLPRHQMPSRLVGDSEIFGGRRSSQMLVGSEPRRFLTTAAPAHHPACSLPAFRRPTIKLLLSRAPADSLSLSLVVLLTNVLIAVALKLMF